MLYDVTGDAMYQVTGGDAPSVTKLDAKDMPIHFAGCATITLGASTTGTLSFNLDMLMRGDWLILTTAVATKVNVQDYRVGAISVNASSDGACGDAFQHNTTSRLKPAVSGSPSVPIKVTLLNKTTDAITLVSACLKGPVKRVA
jgi:hypothetical protein